MKIEKFTKEEELNVYMCLRHCQGVYYTTGVLPLIDITVIEKLLENKLTEDKGEKCSCQPGLENLENGIHPGYCKFCGKLLPHGSGVKGGGSVCKYNVDIKCLWGSCEYCFYKKHPKPKTLEDVLDSVSHNGQVVGVDDEILSTYALTSDLASAIRTHIKEIVERCLVENDSATHVITKDLFEKLGITK